MQKAILCFICSFLITLIISPLIIKLIKAMKGKQSILSYVDKHQSKQGTLTIGGLIFIFGAGLSFLLFCNGNNKLAFFSLLIFLGYGLLGFLDDFIKVKFKQNLGLRAYQKFIGQIGIGVIVGIFVYNSSLVSNEILIPFTDISIKIGWWIIPFITIFFAAVTNSVNFLDGLDGLAGSVTTIVLLVLSVLIGIVNIPAIQEGFASQVQNEELFNLIILSVGLAGAVLAFLALNSYPAKIFMGDTGSLALGGYLSAVLTFTGQYFIIIVIGIMYVATTVSIMLQVSWFKLTGKRIFKMAPLHHHFEQCGWHENKIVTIYIIITILFGALSIMLSL